MCIRLKSALASSSKHHNTNINNETAPVARGGGGGGEGSECTERDLLIPLGFFLYKIAEKSTQRTFKYF